MSIGKHQSDHISRESISNGAPSNIDKGSQLLRLCLVLFKADIKILLLSYFRET